MKARYKPFKDDISDVFRDMHLEAGWLGIATARGFTDAARERVKATVALDVTGRIDWDGWTPGNPALVETFLGEGRYDYPNFQAFLERAGVTIRGVEETRLNDLGSILARSAEAGLSMDATASMIQSEFFGNGAWAEKVARTEIRRASTESALGYYAEAGIEQKEWLVAWDEACEICQEAADMGPIPLDADFGEAGDGPPGHPNCLCVILPVIAEPEAEPEGDLSEGETVEPDSEPVIEEEPEAITASNQRTFQFADASETRWGATYDDLPNQEQWINDLSDDEKKALRDYTGKSGDFSADELNYGIRTGQLTAEQEERLSLIDNAIANADTLGITAPSELYRGMPLELPTGPNVGLSDSEVFSRIADLAQEKYSVGDVISLGRGSVVSTSTDISPALDASASRTSPGVIFEIAPTTGAPLQRLTKFDDEYEFLLSGKSEFLVRNVLREVPFEYMDGTTRTRTVIQLERVMPEVLKMFVNAEITKAPRAAVNNALAMLANLPTVETRDGKELIATPWPVVERPNLDPDMWIDSVVTDVPIVDLFATQNVLNRERVAEFVQNPGAIENGRRALANVYDNGRMLIVDGHHRLAAYWLLGAERANVWYLVES